MLAAYSGNQSFLDSIRDAPVEIDQWQLERLALGSLKHRLLFYTPGAKPEQLGCLAAQTFANLDDAIAAVVDGLPPGGRLALVPDGPYAYARAVALEATVA
jgi:hypothetical protein